MKNLLPLLLLLLPFLFWVNGATAQIRPATAALAERIERVAITTLPRGSGGLHLKDSTAIALRDSATAAELLQLTRHPSPTVRTTALLALLERPDRDSLDLHLLPPQHFHDTAAVRIEVFEQYNYGKDTRVGELFLDAIRGYSFDLLWMYSGFRLEKAPKEWLDSVFLCSNTSFNYMKLGLARDFKPKATLYPCIRQLVESGQDGHASVFLAKYQRTEDIGLIIRDLPENKLSSHGNRWQPFEYFQHPQLFAFLEKDLANSWQNAFYQQQVAKYKNRDAAALLDSVYLRIKSLEKRQLELAVYYLRNAMMRSYDSVFAGLYLRILSDFPKSQNVGIPDGLWETHADTLCSLYSVWKNGSRVAKDRALKMMPKVIEHLQKADAVALEREIVSRIVPGLDMNTYGDHPADRAATVKAYTHIYQTRSPAFIEPLFDVLKKEPLGKNRFFVAKLLLGFDDPSLRGRLAFFFKENPTLAPSLKDAEEGGSFYSNFVHKAENP
jgi:hypothetical protein